MREEIEAAASFITKLVNRTEFSQSPSGSLHNSQNNINRFSNSSSASASSATGAPTSTHQNSSNHSTHSSSAASTASTSSASSSCSDSHPSLEDTSVVVGPSEEDEYKLEQFRQCLAEALFERFQHHWFPDQPTKGQAYRCIRLNPWDRHDINLQKACSQCGIDYKDLHLPVELTLWVDPEEVTCRFGETKGSHCLVATFTKDAHLNDKNYNLAI